MSDNASEVAKESLCTWLTWTWMSAIQNTPIPSSIKNCGEDGPDYKSWIEGILSRELHLESYLPRLLISYRTIPHAGKTQSPSTLMGKWIRTPLTMSYLTNENVCYKQNKDLKPEKAQFVVKNVIYCNINKKWTWRVSSGKPV